MRPVSNSPDPPLWIALPLVAGLLVGLPLWSIYQSIQHGPVWLPAVTAGVYALVLVTGWLALQY
jgi:hypothetical protein